MNVRSRQIALLLVLALLVGCRQSPAQPSPLVVWFDCVECTPAQLAAVKALGDQAVPDLRSTLMGGPSDARIAAERQRLHGAFQAMKDYERRHPQSVVKGTEQEYIDLYLPAFVLRNRIRSAAALGAIATPDARKALEDAQALPNLPKILQREIANALAPPSP